MSARQQRDWAASLGTAARPARLPTAAEVDAIWHSACVQVPPVPRDVASAPLTELDVDVTQTLSARGEVTDRIAAGKTWIQSDKSSATRATNYGWHVPRKEVSDGPVPGESQARLRRPTWRGIPVYPDSMGGYVIQPAAQAHTWDHVDYSQLGYAVRRASGTVSASEPPDTKPSGSL